MKPRMNFYQAAPDTMKALMALEEQIQSTGLEKSLIELVKIRASQINGCAFCINMHTEDARKRGETEQRIYLLNAWRESPLYTDRERAALAWTESVTLISETHAPDDVYAYAGAPASSAVYSSAIWRLPVIGGARRQGGLHHQRLAVRAAGGHH